MNAPIITSRDREWAGAIVANAPRDLSREAWDRALIAVTGRPMGDWDAPYRYDPSDDYDFARDEGDQDVSGGLADRQAAKEWWRATGGDQ